MELVDPGPQCVAPAVVAAARSRVEESETRTGHLLSPGAKYSIRLPGLARKEYREQCKRGRGGETCVFESVTECMHK